MRRENNTAVMKVTILLVPSSRLRSPHSPSFFSSSSLVMSPIPYPCITSSSHSKYISSLIPSSSYFLSFTSSSYLSSPLPPPTLLIFPFLCLIFFCFPHLFFFLLLFFVTELHIHLRLAVKTYSEELMIICGRKLHVGHFTLEYCSVSTVITLATHSLHMFKFLRAVFSTLYPSVCLRKVT